MSPSPASAATSSSARLSSRALARRSSGRRAIARSMTPASSTPIVGFRRSGATSLPRITSWITAAVPPANGATPVAMW